MKTQTPANKEIEYLRFLNNTLQIKQLRKELCDEFTRNIFFYLNNNPSFDSQVFCVFLYIFIHKCQLYKNLFMTRQDNVYDKIRLDAGKIENELYFFLDSSSVRFVLNSVDPNQFPNISIDEKLKQESIAVEVESRYVKVSKKLKPLLKTPSVKIILPEIGGNARIVPYLDLEFTLPHLSIEQKLDILHFAICALNYLSQKDEPVETYSNPEISSTVYVSKPEHLKFISEKLNILRDSMVLNAFRDIEFNDEELNNVEFDENASDVARILQAQTKDREIEKQWLDKDLPILSKNDSELISVEKSKKTSTYPPHYLQQIIDTAVRLCQSKDKVRASDIYTELQIEKNTYNKRIKYFNYDSSMIIEKAREIIREKERKKL